MKGLYEDLPERLVSRQEKEKVEKIFLLGEWEWTEIDGFDDVLDAELDAYETYLYYKYTLDDYGEFKKDGVYRGLYNSVKPLTRGSTNLSRKNIQNIIQAILEEGYKDPRQHDEALLSHIEKQVDPSSLTESSGDYADEAGEIWIRYLLERGIDERITDSD